MWLLNTARAELHFFPSPESVPRGYAILSHVWDREEQTFQDTQNLRTRCAITGDNPRDLASPKVRQFCMLAQRHGYDWGWDDTCCIDKTSSAELSEAINSMFQYYSLAEICYAYLRDVPHNPDTGSVDVDAFKASVWHTRGWTLQELIAPEVVIFLSADWEVMGSKADLAHLLQESTNIPASVLSLETEVADISIAARMSWAAKRRTTRVEDEAYCLLGIFGINMPTLYGEGRKAFRRLQEEIMRQSVDTSLFAWGGLYPAPGSERDTLDHVVHCQAPEALPLAPSPSAFRQCRNHCFVPPDPQDIPLWRARQPSLSSVVRTLLRDRENTARSSRPTTLRESVGMPTFTITSYGILAHVPVVEALQSTVVVLYCSDGKQHLGLPITRCPDTPDAERPLYHVNCYFPRGVYHRSVGRLVGLGGNVNDLRLNGQQVVPEWKSIYLAHYHPPVPPTRALIDRGIAAPFRIPRSHIRDLQRQSNVRLLKVEHFGLEVPWSGLHSAAFIFEYAHPSIPDMFPDPFYLYLARCATSQNQGSGDSPSVPGPHWATIRSPAPQGLEHIHSCAVDHIRDWADAMKRFVLWNGLFEVVLRFTPCPLNPSGTLIVNVDFTKDPFSSAEATTQLSEYLKALALDS